MSDRITSVSGAVLRGPEVSEVEREGAQTRYVWTGTLEQCQAQRVSARASGARSIDLGPGDGGNWQLSVTYAGLPEDEGGPESEPPVDRHELETVFSNDDYRKSKKVQTLLTPTAASIVHSVFEFYKKDGYSDTSEYCAEAQVAATWLSVSGGAYVYTPKQRAALDVTRMLTRASIASENTVALAYLNRLIFCGGEGIPKYESVYIRTITAASYEQVQAAYTGVGSIWTSAEVESFEGVPTDEWFGLPSTQWLKHPPRVTASAGGKTDIEYRYQGGFDSANPVASKFFFTAYSGATLLD